MFTLSSAFCLRINASVIICLEPFPEHQNVCFCQFYPTLYKVALCRDILTASLDYSIVTVILVLHEKRQAQSHLGLSRYSSFCLDDPIGIWPAPSSKSDSFKSSQYQPTGHAIPPCTKRSRSVSPSPCFILLHPTYHLLY